MTPWLVTNLWLIPAMPLAVSLVIAVYRHYQTTNVDQLDQLKG